MEKIQILRVHNSADPQEEYVLLKVNEDMNLDGFMILDRTQDEDGVSDKHRHVFLFPACKVKKGEYVSLRTGTKNGKRAYEKGVSNSGEPVHRFYWGLKAPVWNDKGYEDVELRKTAVWDRKTVNPPAPLFPSLQRRLKK